MSSKLIIFLLGFMFLQSGECSQSDLPPDQSANSECVNCQCLIDVGDYVFSGAKAVENEADIFQSDNCLSPDLPPPGNLMVAGVISRNRVDAGSDGSLENCHDQWGILVERLSSGEYLKDCSAEDASNELLTRCDEDSYILSMFSQYHELKSADGNQLLSESPSDCKDIGPVFSALYVLIRFENTMYLNGLVRSGTLENLIIEGDEDTEKALYLLTQHSENFPQVQTAILDLRLSLLAQGIGVPRDIAALADRIQIMQDQTQLYGTHTSCESSQAVLSKPVDDINAANQRRASIGLPSVQDFLASASGGCDQQP